VGDGRQKTNTTGLRQLLIAADDAFREAWRQPQVWDRPGKNRELPMSDGVARCGPARR
jgi:hypothetical protein